MSRWRSRSLSPLLVVVLLPASSLPIGCIPATSSQSSTHVDAHRYTGLSKCKKGSLAVNNPLVTQWPASEKAHLQGLVENQAIAVQYQGCELRIVEECKVKGKYNWKRTSLSTDTVEILNQDDLFAKLPVGALGLEGTLENFGRLAVKTTVVGQLQLDEFDTVAVSANENCATATHLIRAVSVGSYVLTSGGRISAQGGIQTAGVGVGGGSKHQESVFSQAGSPEDCPKATDEKPDIQCASPLQMFLVPLPKTQVRENQEQTEMLAAKRDGIRMNFLANASGERWSVRDADDHFMCAIPCTRWLNPAHNYKVRFEEGKATKFIEYPIPKEMLTTRGSDLEATVTSPRGSVFWSSLTFYGLGIPAGIGGAILLILGLTSSSDDDPNDRTSTSSSRKGFFYGAGLMYTSIAVASGIWYFYSRGGGVEYRDLPSQQARRLSSPNSPIFKPTIRISPFGLSGTF
jgi:hypothetical protein